MVLNVSAVIAGGSWLARSSIDRFFSSNVVSEACPWRALPCKACTSAAKFIAFLGLDALGVVSRGLFLESPPKEVRSESAGVKAGLATIAHGTRDGSRAEPRTLDLTTILAQLETRKKADAARSFF